MLFNLAFVSYLLFSFFEKSSSDIEVIDLIGKIGKPLILPCSVGITYENEMKHSKWGKIVRTGPETFSYPLNLTKVILSYKKLKIEETPIELEGIIKCTYLEKPVKIDIYLIDPLKEAKVHFDHQNQYLFLKQEVTFRCRVIPTVNFNWKDHYSVKIRRKHQEQTRTGVTLDKNEEDGLETTMFDLTLKDQGEYECILFSEKNKRVDTTTCTLHLRDPSKAPQLYFEKESQLLFLQQTATLTCVIADQADLSWRHWYSMKIRQRLSHQELKPGPSISMDQAFNYGINVSLFNLTLKDQGDYECVVVAKGISKEFTTTCTLHLRDPSKAPQLYFEKKSQFLLLQQRVTLTCVIADRNLHRWRELYYMTISTSNHEELIEGPRIIINRTNDFGIEVSILDLTLRDEGVYECKLLFKGTTKKVGSTTCTIHVKDHAFLGIKTNCERCSPTYIIIPGNQDKVNIEFECLSYPSAEISWFKDGIKINEKNVIHNTNKNLLLHIKDRRTDGGSYTITAQVQGDFGIIQDTKIYFIEIRSIPVITVKSSLETVSSSKNKQVYCHVYGNPKPNVMWFWKPITECHSEIPDKKWLILLNFRNFEKDSIIKSVINVSMEANKKLRCHATNSQGSSDSHITLIRTDQKLLLDFEKDAEIIENSPVEIKFFANSCFYQPPITCHVRFGQNHVEMGTEPSEDLFYTSYSKTQYSHVVTIRKKMACRQLYTFICVVTENKRAEYHDVQLAELKIQAIGRTDPKFTVFLPEKTYFYSSFVNLTCKAIAKPHPSIHWLYEGKLLLVPTNRSQDNLVYIDHDYLEPYTFPGFTFSFSSSNTTLMVEGLKKFHDLSTITCVATNSKSSVSSSTTLVEGIIAGTNYWFAWLLMLLVLLPLGIFFYKKKKSIIHSFRSTTTNIGSKESDLWEL